MTKNQLGKFIKKLKGSQQVIAKERDKLRAFADDADDLANDCDEAWESLQHAIDRLSELQ